MKKIIPVFICAALLSACTQHPKVEAMSQPSVLINTKNTKQIINKLTEICDRERLQIDNSDAHSVNCSREAPILAQAFLGTRYGTNVRSRIRFTVISLNTTTKVVGKAWFENQTAFGQTRTNEVEGGDTYSVLYRMLQQAKQEIEGGKR